MGFFKRKRKESKAAREAAKAATAGAMIKGLSAGASTLVFGGLGVGVLVGAPRLQARLAQRAAAGPVRVVFDWPTSGDKGKPATWLPGHVQEELLAAASREMERSPDPFSADGLRRIAEAAAGSGWFEQILGVRRESGGVVRVSGVWRAPAAVVRREGRDYLVSRKGEVLPLSFEQGGSTLKAIVGSLSEPVRAGGRVVSGAVWPGADVRAGLDLLAVVASRPWASQVAAIDVGGYQGKKELVLVTASGGRVVWGAAVNEAVPGQVSSEVKLRRLDYIQAQFNAIDARHRIVEVAGPKVLVDDTATANAQ